MGGASVQRGPVVDRGREEWQGVSYGPRPRERHAGVVPRARGDGLGLLWTPARSPRGPSEAGWAWIGGRQQKKWGGVALVCQNRGHPHDPGGTTQRVAGATKEHAG